MILITKNEAKHLREKGFGDDIHISSSTHKARAKRYYLTTNRGPIEELKNYRNSIGIPGPVKR